MVMHQERVPPVVWAQDMSYSVRLLGDFVKEFDTKYLRFVRLRRRPVRLRALGNCRSCQSRALSPDIMKDVAHG